MKLLKPVVLYQNVVQHSFLAWISVKSVRWAMPSVLRVKIKFAHIFFIYCMYLNHNTQAIVTVSIHVYLEEMLIKCWVILRRNMIYIVNKKNPCFIYYLFKKKCLSFWTQNYHLLAFSDRFYFSAKWDVSTYFKVLIIPWFWEIIFNKSLI